MLPILLALLPAGRAALQQSANAAESRTRASRRTELREAVLSYAEAVHQAPTPEARVRAQDRLVRARDRLELYEAELALRKAGRTNPSEVELLTMRRDRLLKRRAKAKPLELENIDARLPGINAEIVRLNTPQIGAVAVRTFKDRRRMLNPARRQETGVGGLSFQVMSPPGPARLVRVPFFPQTDAQSWVGVNGIDEAGDCPILDLQIANLARQSIAMTMLTPTLDYAKYRIVGLQVNLQESYRHSPLAVRADDVAISLFDFTVYNGAELFVQAIGSGVDARTFSIRQLGQPNANGLGIVQEQPFNWERRRSRFFVGFRDNPVMTTTAQARIVLRAFTINAIGGGLPLRVPVSVNLVVDILEDDVLGDPVNPSPASRAGAQIKVQTKDLGTDLEGRSRLELRASRYTPPSSS